MFWAITSALPASVGVRWRSTGKTDTEDNASASPPLHDDNSKTIEVQEMSFITLTRDEEIELKEIQLARQSLERFFASPSGKAGVAEFYTEVAQSEGSSLEVVQSKALAAIDELTRAFWVLDRTSKRADKVIRWSKSQRKQAVTLSEQEILLNRVNRAYHRIYRKFAKTYQSIARIVDANWNYLPVELQVITESLARRLYLREQSILRSNLQDDPLEIVPSSFLETLKGFVFLVFDTAERNKGKHKLELFKLFKCDKSIERLEEEAKLPSETEAGLTEIKEVVQKLAELPNVYQVRAIANSSNNLYEVTFEVLPSNIDSPENGELVKRAISLVIDAEWKLSDLTNNESWLFGVQMVGGFELNPKDNRVVASSYVQP